MDRRARRGLALVLFFCAAPSAEAGIPLVRRGDGFELELGIRIQLQYYDLGGESGSERKLFFRRLRPALEASFSPGWEAEAELDFGDAIEGDAVEFKDVFLSYRGWEPRGLRFTFGNEKAVYSRQFQSSSRSLTLIERGVVGVDDFGTLDRILGARVDGRDSSGRISGGASLGLAAHERGATEMEFESPLNAREDASRGWALSGRFELAPLGEVPYDQGDFGTEELRFALGVGGYRWSKDGSTGSPGATRDGLADLERSRGIELSGALRGRGFSTDAEVQWVHGVASDPLTMGLYESGEADLSKLSLQSGYLVFRDRLEIVGGFDRLDAEAYASPWKRLTLGATHYWKMQQLKLQINYLQHWSRLGIEGDDPKGFATQLQVVF